MGEEMDRFDADYEVAKNEIKDNLSFLENEYDMMAILAWISRLEEPAECPEAKAIRNEYTKYLAHQLARQTLHYPFTEDPPQGTLPPLCVSMVDPICSESTCKYELPESERLSSVGRSCEQPKRSLHINLYGTTLPTMAEFGADSLNKTGYTEWPLAASSPIVPRKPCPGLRTSKGPPTPLPKAPCEPCGPCDLNVSTPFKEKIGCPAYRCRPVSPCPVPPSAPRPHHGYLSKTSEEDDRPFSPPMPCTEENQTRLEKIVEAVDDETELYEFLSEVAPFTCDLGETMHSVASEELTHFKEFVRSVYQSRMSDAQEILTKEHVKLKSRYDEWESNVLRQAQSALRALKLMLPLFKYDSYKRDPEYLYYMLRNQMALEEAESNPQARILRAKAQKKTWLNEEAQRIEKDNMDRMVQMRELNAQLSALSNSYNANHKRLTDTNKCLEDQAAKLRIRHDENQKLIDHLIDQLNTPPRNY